MKSGVPQGSVMISSVERMFEGQDGELLESFRSWSVFADEKHQQFAAGIYFRIPKLRCDWFRHERKWWSRCSCWCRNPRLVSSWFHLKFMWHQHILVEFQVKWCFFSPGFRRFCLNLLIRSDPADFIHRIHTDSLFNFSLLLFLMFAGVSCQPPVLRLSESHHVLNDSLKAESLSESCLSSVGASCFPSRVPCSPAEDSSWTGFVVQIDWWGLFTEHEKLERMGGGGALSWRGRRRKEW